MKEIIGVIRLKAKDSNYDTKIHEIYLTHSDSDNYYGFPCNNYHCPELKYPKFAWGLESK